MPRTIPMLVTAWAGQRAVFVGWLSRLRLYLPGIFSSLPMSLKPSLIATAAVTLALLASPARAELLMEERDGVLYVKEIPPPPPVAERPAAPAEMAAGRSGSPYSELIRRAAERNALPPELVESVIRVESNFEPRAVSPKGARGLMQLMPGTARLLGVQNAFDVRQNIEGGTRHLKNLMDQYRGNVVLALAAYNAGAEAVARYGGVPPYAETQAYVARIVGLLRRAGWVTAAEAAEQRRTETAPVEEGRALHKYETADGQVIYSNLPAERLSVSVREMLETPR